MSTDRDVTRTVRSWLEEGATALPDTVLDAILDKLPTTPQRRASWLAWRFPEMNNTAKLALGAAAVLVVAFLGIRFLVPGSLSVGGDPDPTASPKVLPLKGPQLDGPLGAGRYSTDNGFPVTITFDLPAGWAAAPEGVYEQNLIRNFGTEGARRVIGIGFLVVENVVADPCSGAVHDPAVGPSVDDLVTALSNLPGFTATAAENVIVGGYDAKRITVTAPMDAGCDLTTWTTPTRANGVGPGEANTLYAVDVDGVRVVISVAHSPAVAADEDFAEVEEIIDSIQIEP